jgi:protocatechuate 3,4-dioxygenase beta subunit
MFSGGTLKKLLALTALFACVATLSAATGPKAALGTGSIAGRITDSVTGQPIAGAKVMAGCCGQSATTGGDGTYIITGLAAGDYTVKAMKCGAYVMKAYPTPVHVAEGQAVTGINIALAPMGGGGGNGSISGTVYNKKTNAPIAGAKVMTGCCGKYVLTAEDGTYTISGLADGSYTVKAVKTGYQCATYHVPVVIQSGGAVTGIDFYLVATIYQALD